MKVENNMDSAPKDRTIMVFNPMVGWYRSRYFKGDYPKFNTSCGRRSRWCYAPYMWKEITGVISVTIVSNLPYSPDFTRWNNAEWYQRLLGFFWRNYKMKFIDQGPKQIKGLKFEDFEGNYTVENPYFLETKEGYMFFKTEEEKLNFIKQNNECKD